MEKSGAHRSKALQSQLNSLTLTFRNRELERECLDETFEETRSYATVTWSSILVSWTVIGCLLAIAYSRLPEPSDQRLPIAFFISGILFIAWWRLSRSKTYRKFHQFVQFAVYALLAWAGIMVLAALPDRYHGPAFTFFVLSILAPYVIANVSLLWAVATGLILSIIFGTFSVLTESYPTAEGGPFFFATYLLAANAIGIIVKRYKEILRRIQFLTNKTLDAERSNSDRLLYALFPTNIANSLKCGMTVDPIRYDDASVIFLDLQGFTAWSAKAEPKRIVSVLDELFTKLDATAQELYLDKIKTIGDAYMACANLTHRSENSALNAIKFGFQAIAITRDIGRHFEADGSTVRLRVGIATGSVVAGISGTLKPTFDIWSDTVNLASRLESSGQPDTVNICTRTMELANLGETAVYTDSVLELKGFGRMKAFSIHELNPD